MSDDDLFDRMRNADPARTDAPADSWLDDLVEETMSITPQSTRRRWLPAAAAAAVVAVVAGGIGFAMTRGDDAPTPTAQKTVTELRVQGEDATQMCMQVTPEALRNVDQAFEGTATEVTDDRIVLTVDRWFKGGSSDEVALTPADTGMVALIGSVEFEQGGRYLVTAADGLVNSCGFSGEWSPELAALFDQAFSG